MQEKEIKTEIIGAFLREKRKEKKINLQDMADLVGVTAGYLSTVERGINSPKTEVIERLLIALGVSVEEFSDEIEKEAVRESKEVGQTFAMAKNLEEYFKDNEKERKIKYSLSIQESIDMRAINLKVLLSEKEKIEIAELVDQVIATRINQIKGDK